MPHFPTAVRRARVALFGYFGVLGASAGVWLARIPSVKQSLELTEAELGLALFAMPLGVLVVLTIAGRLADRYGSARVTWPAGPLAALTLIPPGFATGLPGLATALFVFGAASGLLDMAMNAHGVRVEREYGRPIMASLHACFSIGGLAGAAFGGVLAWAEVIPLWTFVAGAVPLALLAAGLGPLLLRPPDPPAIAPGAVDGRPEGRRRASRRGGRSPVFGPPGYVVILGLLALCGQVGEGAAGDWSGVYLHENLGSSAGFAASGYAAFSVTMALGRLLGDRLALRFGSVRLVRGCGLLAGAGLLAGLLSQEPIGGVAGFALLGAGLSCVLPQFFSAAGNADPERAGRNIARVAGISYAGLLGGPVLIGGVAGLVGLPLALGIPVLLALVIAVAARTVDVPTMAPARAAANREGKI